MKIRNIAGLVLVGFAVAACSLGKSRIDYKVASARVPSLEVPPDLTVPTANEQYAIPGGDGALMANYSDYSKGAVAMPGQGAVLPTFNNVQLERNAEKHWLLVSDKAESVWPVVKAFWADMGFQLQVDNPQAGVMETDWQENRGNVPKRFVRRVLGNGKVLDSLYTEGERDQFLTRFERSKDGGSTEIYVTQQAMHEVQAFNKKDFYWLPHASNPEIELAVLQMLKVKLGGAASSVSALPASAVTAASAVPVATAMSARLVEGAEGKIIQLNEPFDKSWRKVGLALEQAHIAVEDKDRSSGIYILRASAGSKTKKPYNYQVKISEKAQGCEVAVHNAEGASDKESVRIVEALYQNIEK